ncbi:BON domain-containing protein [Rickettsia endosymbiont of Cardiosporidium cionae]|uniref:BON domain-containing protein n=1 Tax=Rickettsia endosymbiont of Cardiosporidium cionae TaxID=2777155 RepID=UPI0018951EFC|nr:BON domain-containing protein [Rickettsia endosymbiont of Cardiosporidium cionae]KAF8818461.1 BON domain-containing protein [Rickettsia endosymbiont of Cardiosporidium cionae]
MKIIAIVCTLILPFLCISCTPLIIGGAIATGVVMKKDTSCKESVGDIYIESKIKMAFIQNRYTNLYSKIKVQVSRGVVVCIGSVSNNEEIVKALKIIWNIKGVKKVINELQITKSGNKLKLEQYTKDSFVTSQILSRAILNKKISVVNYSIITNNSIVYIMGIKRSEEELNELLSIASKIYSVKKVINHTQDLNQSN